MMADLDGDLYLPWSDAERCGDDLPMSRDSGRILRREDAVSALRHAIDAALQEGGDAEQLLRAKRELIEDGDARYAATVVLEVAAGRSGQAWRSACSAAHALFLAWRR